jgi:hypothetical protein
MSDQTGTTNNIEKRRNGALVGGALLISIGLYSLLENLFHMEWGLYFLPMLAVVFLAGGLYTRRPGLLIPGGILAGIGGGAIVVDQYMHYFSDQARGGTFLVVFAAGWLLITLASMVIGRLMLWPLFPAAFLGMTGAALLAGQTGLQLLTLFGYFWPAVLIVLGLYLILRRRSS